MPKSGKGAAWERELCKRLSLWWSGGERDDLFWRTANSGGRATVRGRKGVSTSGHYGDICATDAAGEPFLRLFACETKRGYSTDTLADLLDKPPGATPSRYASWIERAEEVRLQAKAYFWLLIVRRDRRLPLVLLPDGAADGLDLFLQYRPSAQLALNILGGDSLIYVTTLDNFFSQVSPKRVEEFLNAMS